MTAKTNCWWVRHAPLKEYIPGRYIGHTDIEALLPPQMPKMEWPGNAVWFSSPLKRATQTAHWLMAASGADKQQLQFSDALKEQHFGAWEGKMHDDIWREHASRYDWHRPETVRPDHGESFEDVCKRVDGWLEQTLAKHAGSPLVIVAHAGTIRAGLRHALGLTSAQALLFQLDYTGVTHVEYYQGEPKAALARYVNRLYI